MLSDAHNTACASLADPCDAACMAAFANQNNADYAGNDLAGSPITTAGSPDECQYGCYSRTDCLAFTFFNGLCYYKSAAANLVAKTGYVTGAKLSREWLLSYIVDQLLVLCSPAFATTSPRPPTSSPIMASWLRSEWLLPCFPLDMS